MESISDMLVRHEGLRLRVYNDSVGIPTIGVGRNLRDRGLTKDEAMYLLDNDIKDFTQQLSDKLEWFDFKPLEVRNVLIDMGFNMGIAGLLTFHNTLAHIERGDYQTAAITMLDSKWARQVGRRAIELSNILKGIVV